MIHQQPNKYLENSILTASPAQLLIMLCDGGIRFCKLAIEAVHKQDYTEAHRNTCKAQDIISEFVITLDKKSPLAESLLKLYDYFLHLLIDANVKKEIAPLEEVLGYLLELKEMWVQAAKISNSSRVGAQYG